MFVPSRITMRRMSPAQTVRRYTPLIGGTRHGILKEILNCWPSQPAHAGMYVFKWAPIAAASKRTGVKLERVIGIVFLLLVTFCAQARDWYVDNAANGAGNGTS